MIPTRIRRLVADTANYVDIKKQYHPEPNVMNHLGQVATLAIQAKEDWDMVMAAVLHDIGKNKKCQKAWSQHAYRGAMMVCSDVNERVKWLVENHMRIWPYLNGEMKVYKRATFAASPYFDDVRRLNLYDNGGRNADGVHMPWDEIFAYLDENDKRENTVILMIGIQASGKSTTSRGIVDASRDIGDWWKPGYERTSKDDIRLLTGTGPGAHRHQESCVQSMQHDTIRMALGRGQGVVVDNCHNTIKRRRDMREWLQEEFPGVRVEAHLVHAPLEVCIKRNQDEHGQLHRHRVLVPSTVLTQFYGEMRSGLGAMTNDKEIIARLIAEGFDDATVTRTA